MFNVGPTELMVILILALIVFGPKRLPEMGRTIGKGLREFRKAQVDIKREISQGLTEPPDDGTALAPDGKTLTPPNSLAAGGESPAPDGHTSADPTSSS
jgi:sec-independent protein translocase protein TatA